MRVKARASASEAWTGPSPVTRHTCWERKFGKKKMGWWMWCIIRALGRSTITIWITTSTVPLITLAFSNKRASASGMMITNWRWPWHSRTSDLFARIPRNWLPQLKLCHLMNMLLSTRAWWQACRSTSIIVSMTFGTIVLASNCTIHRSKKILCLFLGWMALVRV